MSSQENRWWRIRSMSRSRRLEWFLGWSRVCLGFAGVALIGAGFQGVIDFATGVGEGPPLVFLLGVLVFALVLGTSLAWVCWRTAQLNAAYAKALQHPEPDAAIDLVVRWTEEAAAMPDPAAWSAHSKAVVFALYGRGEDARRVLGEVEWAGKPPWVLALGVNAEGLVELLCERDANRARALSSQANSLACDYMPPPRGVSFSNILTAVAEALSCGQSPASLRLLRMNATDRRTPLLRLLASFGLAAAMDRAGNREHADRLRAYLRQVAPFCEPLHLPPERFSPATRGSRASSPGPASIALPPVGHAYGGVPQKPAVKYELARRALVSLAWWGAVIAVLVALFAFIHRTR